MPRETRRRKKNTAEEDRGRGECTDYTEEDEEEDGERKQRAKIATPGKLTPFSSFLFLSSSLQERLFFIRPKGRSKQGPEAAKDNLPGASSRWARKETAASRHSLRSKRRVNDELKAAPLLHVT